MENEVLKPEYYVWYFLTVKDGKKVGIDDLVVKSRDIGTCDNKKNMENKFKQLGHQGHIYTDEDTANNELREYKKQLSKIVKIEGPVITNDNISGFQKTVPQLLASGESVKHPAPDSGIPLVKDIKTDTPVVSQTQNNINTNKVSEAIGEEPQPISNKETDTNWGGKRSGAGRKKGPQGPQTQEHIDKRIAKLKETAKQRRELRNAAKNK